MQRVMSGLAMLLSVAVLALMAVDLRRFIVEQHITPFTVDSPLAFIIFVMSLLTVFIVINGIQDMRRLKTQDHEDGDARQGACALLWVLEGAERAGLTIAREPGSVISGCLANIDPITSPLGANKASLLNMLGSRWRKGVGRIEDLHETALLRWVGNANYRPRPLTRFGARMVGAVQDVSRAA